MSRYAKELNIVHDVQILHEALGIREICLIVFRISGLLLQTGIKHQLTPREIAKFYIRYDQPSLLEKIVQQCVEHMREYYHEVERSWLEMKSMERGNELSFQEKSLCRLIMIMMIMMMIGI